jgi:hypothetical protein
MKRVAGEQSFPSPYVFEESQERARAYGTACTPDFFGFNLQLDLQQGGVT